MTLQKLQQANNIASDLKKWQDIVFRLSIGGSCCRLNFEAFNTGKGNLTEEYTKKIDDKSTIDAYANFAKSMVEKFEKELSEI
jgi:hypothetical protein